MIKDFNYWLTGVGWAEAFFSNETQNVRFEFSYLSDPLEDLFAALKQMIESGSQKQKISFLDEPGKHLLILSRTNKDDLNVQIFWSDFKEEGDDELIPLSEMKLIYSDTDSIVNFASVIIAGVDSLMSRHTLDEYKEKWGNNPFPIKNFEHLKQIIQRKESDA